MPLVLNLYIAFIHSLGCGRFIAFFGYEKESFSESISSKNYGERISMALIFWEDASLWWDYSCVDASLTAVKSLLFLFFAILGFFSMINIQEI